MKPGIKTTEFWLSLGALLLGVAMFLVNTLGTDGSTVGQLVAAGVSLFGVLGYAVPRASVKKAEIVAPHLGGNKNENPT